jgi:hypothetical protein
MAWPFTPLTTYISGSLPAVKALDLNELQEYINHWINGDVSVMHATVDGTGDVDTSAQANGTLVVSGSAASVAITGTGGAGAAGVHGLGGSGSSVGVTGLGTGAGAGASFEGGPTDGIGVNAVGGGADGVGLAATGQGSGAAVVATAGDIIATSGKIKTMAGNIVADGTPVGDAGPGLLKGKRHYSTGTALTVGRFDCGVGWGGAAGADAAAVAGTDEACLVTVAASGIPTAANCTIVLNYIDGTWTTAPIVDVVFKNSTDAASLGQPVAWTVTNTAVTITFGDGAFIPTAGQNYEFVIKSIGY